MPSIENLPFVTAIAEWLWGAHPSDEVSPEICLSEAPFVSLGCLSALISKALGILIIVGACLNKAPVIKNILDSRSVAGFTAGALYTDIVVCSNSAIYGIRNDYPFTAFGENIALTIQCIVIALLMWQFKDAPAVSSIHRVLVSVAYILYLIGAFYFLPLKSVYLLMTVIWPLLLYARGSMIWETYRIKHTGAQSIITTVMSFGGSLIRIITTMNEMGGDIAVLLGFMLSVATNGILMFQYWIYLDNTKNFVEEQKIKKIA